jgi:hypothetical protein
MKRPFQFFVTLVTILVFTISCYYDNEEALYPSLSSSCDTTNVTFSGKIVPMMENSCLSCHSNATAASAGNNIRLENYADIKAQTASVSGAIHQTGNLSPMPKNGGKLNACLLNQFDIWIRNGALNN